MYPKRGVARGALVAIILVISLVGIACGGSAGEPAASPASSGAAGSASTGQDYRSIVVQRTKSLQQSLEDLNALLQSPQFKDPSWKAQVAKELDAWNSAYTEAQQLTPPDAYRAFHEKYLAGLSQFHDAADYLQKGIDNQNFSAVGEAIGKVTVAGKTIGDASAQLPKQ